MATAPPTLLRSVSSGLYQRRIRISYLAATSILALLAVVSYLVLHQISIDQQYIQDGVSLNRRQRTLSHQVTVLATQLVNEANATERVELRNELTQRLEEIESNDLGYENGLIPNYYSDGSSLVIDENLHALYFAEGNLLHGQLHQYLDSAWALLNTPDTELSQDNPHYIEILDTALTLFDSLDSMSIQLQEIDEAKLNLANQVELFILGSTLLALALNVAFIFRPMENRILKRDKALRAEAEKQTRLVEELSRSEAHYRLLMDTMHEAFLIFDDQDRIIYANNQFYNLLGYSGEETIGKSTEFLDESSLPVIAEEAAKRLKGESSTYEATFKHKDGRRIQALISGSPIFDTQGYFQGSFVTLTDITERKRSEEELRTSETRYRMLIDRMSEGVMIGDANHRLTYVNEQFARLLGYTPEELIGHMLDDFIDEASRQIRAEQRARRLQGESGRYELTLVRKDRQKIFAMLSGTPLMDAEGNYQGSFGVLTDITKRKQSEDAVRHSETLYRQLVQNLPDTAVLMYDRDLRFTLVEGSFLEAAGYSKAAMEGKTLYQVVSPQAHNLLLPTYEAVLRGEEFQYERPIIDNPNVVYHAHFTPLRDDSGQIIGGMVVTRDVTEQKRNEQVIREKERMLRTVIDNLPSHVYVKDTESRFVLANKAALPNLGINSEEELIGKSDFDFLQQDAERFREAEAALMTSGVPLLDSEETWISQKTGETLWFSVNKIPLRDDNGKVIGLVGINHDITQRKQMEHALLENETMLRQLTDSIPEIFWVFDAKTQIPIFISRAYERIYGRPTEDSKQPVEKRLKFIYPDDRERFVAEVSNTMATGAGIIEYRIIRTDGEIRWLRSLNSPVYDDSGNLYRVAVVTEDITERKRMEQTLLEKQEFIERVTSTVPDMIYLYDLLDGSTHYLNHALTDELGYTTADILRMGDTFARDIMHPDDVERQANLFVHVSAANPNDVVENEYRMLHASGEWRWFYSRDIVFEWTKDDKPRRILGITRDITDFKQAQEAIKQSERLLRTVIDNIPALIYVKDIESRFLLGNQAIVRQMNVSSEADLLGKSDFDFHPAELANGYRTDEIRVIETGQAMVNRVEQVFYHGTQSYGWSSTSKLPLRDENGELVGIVGIGYDITERKQMEELLLEKQQFIERITNTIPDSLYIYDLVHQLTLYINHPLQEILGYNTDEAIQMGDDFFQLVTHPDDLARQLSLFEKVSRDQQTVIENEYRMLHARGEWRWFFSRYVIFSWTDDGKPAELLAIARDVTEQKKNQSMAMELQGEKQRVQVLANFVRDTSHDFRTPITIIATGLETLPLIKDDEKRREKIARIRSYVDYLVKLLNQLQRIAELDTMAQVDKRPSDINLIMQNLVMNLQKSADKKEITLRYELEPDLPPVSVNAGTLQEAIDHLLLNAILFTPTGGTIIARTYNKNDSLILEVQDTGMGISENDLLHIFDRFYKVDQSRALTTGGAGMGLAIVKRVVELHEGKIEVESVIDKGSTFRMVLPMVVEQYPNGFATPH
jgi:PAS domain S-box-containing protein